MTDAAYIKRRFLNAESQRTERRVKLAKQLLDDALQEQGRHLYSLKRADELRLLVLFNWRDKHSVGVLWMLRKLLPIWHKKFSRFRKNAALGCQVPVLVGRKSEEIVQEHIAREFPAGENQREQRERQRQRIERLFLPEARKVETRYKSPLDAINVDDFVATYEKELKQWSRSRSTTAAVSRDLRTLQRMAWRGNPWR